MFTNIAPWGDNMNAAWNTHTLLNTHQGSLIYFPSNKTLSFVYTWEEKESYLYRVPTLLPARHANYGDGTKHIALYTPLNNGKECKLPQGFKTDEIATNITTEYQRRLFVVLNMQPKPTFQVIQLTNPKNCQSIMATKNRTNV